MPPREIARKGCAAKVDALQEAAEGAGLTVADVVAVVEAAIATVAVAAVVVGIKQTDCKRRGMARVFCFWAR